MEVVVETLDAHPGDVHPGNRAVRRRRFDRNSGLVAGLDCDLTHDRVRGLDYDPDLDCDLGFDLDCDLGPGLGGNPAGLAGRHGQSDFRPGRCDSFDCCLGCVADRAAGFGAEDDYRNAAAARMTLADAAAGAAIEGLVEPSSAGYRRRNHHPHRHRNRQHRLQVRP